MHPLVYAMGLKKCSLFRFLCLKILCLFGFNALFYTDSMVEDKIFDKDRDKFVYPLKNEFAKIIESIVLTLALMLIV